MGFRFFFVFFTSIAHGLLQVRGNRASGTFLLVIRQGRGSEATETVFKGKKKPHHTGVRARCHYLIFLSVCVRAFVSGRLCNIRCFYGLRELYEADFHKLGIYGSGRVWANAWDVFRLAPSGGGRGRRAAVDFVVCIFGWGGLFSFFSRFFSFERTRPTARMRPHLSLLEFRLNFRFHLFCFVLFCFVLFF